MKRTFDFDGTPVELNSSMGWFLIYKEQFGHDILPDLMPAIDAVFGLTLDLIGDLNRDRIGLDEILRKLDKDMVSEAIATASGLGATTMVQILWSLAKNANPDIPGPLKWINSFETIPLDEVFMPVINLIFDSCVSKKKAHSLLMALKKKKPNSQQTSSSSEEPTEA